MGYSETFERVTGILGGLEIPVFRNEAAKGAKPPFIIWDETGAHRTRGDNGAASFRALTFRLDLYFKDPMPVLPDRVEALLLENGMPFDDPDMDYDDDFGASLWTWNAEVAML